MEATRTCPRCGTKNPAEAINCISCGINLKSSQENPVEIEGIKLEGESIEQSGGSVMAHDPGGVPYSKDRPILLPVLLLLGSFVFAFCLGEAVHEFGHFLVHRAYGVSVGIRLDPFGGSRIRSTRDSGYHQPSRTIAQSAGGYDGVTITLVGTQTNALTPGDMGPGSASSGRSDLFAWYAYPGG